MADVFISYAKSDVVLVQPLAQELEAVGYSVWWDHHLHGGEEFRDTIVAQIDDAKVVIVCWTDQSVQSPWVRSEAERARVNGSLLPVLAPGFKASTIPPPFGVLHSVEMSDKGALLRSLADKIELDEATRARAAKQRLQRKRVRMTLLTLAAFVLISTGVMWATSSVVRVLVGDMVYRVYYNIFPCEGLTVFVGSKGLGRRICASPSERLRFHDCDECPELVVVAGGHFVIGSPVREPGRDVDESQTEVQMAAFAIGRYEVTIGQWEACVRADACKPRPRPSELTDATYPASFISWNDAKDYVTWLSVRTNRAYRLPTEAEWEYAARAGESAPRFWGFLASEACEYANVSDHSHAEVMQGASTHTNRIWDPASGPHACDDNYARLAPVGQFKANAFGLHDVIGNVWEWVEDCAFPDYRGLPRDGSAYVEPDCRIGMLRGGSFASPPASARSANRFQGGRSRASAQPDFGFRVARTL